MKHTLCGIYKIENMINGKVYIGSSANIHKRLIAHRSTLGRGTHHSRLLQNAWNKYGGHCFKFSTIELVRDVSRLSHFENIQIAQHKAADRDFGYNIAPAAGSNLGIKYGPHSKEHREKIGSAHKGRVVTSETRERLSAALKGRTFHAEWIENMSKAQTGRKMAPLSDEHRAIVSATHKGKTISEEHKQRLREVHTGRNHSIEDRQKKKAASFAFWATLSPEQRSARANKAAATKAAKAAAMLATQQSASLG